MRVNTQLYEYSSNSGASDRRRVLLSNEEEEEQLKFRMKIISSTLSSSKKLLTKIYCPLSIASENLRYSTNEGSFKLESYAIILPTTYTTEEARSLLDVPDSIEFSLESKEHEVITATVNSGLIAEQFKK